MINRLNSTKRKDHKLKIAELIKKQIDNSKKMYKRSSVEEGELLFKKILKKEIDNKKFRDYDEQLRHLFRKTCLVFDYHYRRDNLKIYTKNWNTVKDLIRPTLAAFNCLGKKYSLSNKLARDVRDVFIKDSISIQSNYTYNRYGAVINKDKVVSEMVNILGKYLLEIDDVFAMTVIAIAYRLNQPFLLKLALDKLSEYEISSDAIGIIREMKDMDIIFSHFVKGVEYTSMEKFWKIMLLCFDNKTQAVKHLAMTFSWDNISLEMKTFLLENGFSLPSRLESK